MILFLIYLNMYNKPIIILMKLEMLIYNRENIWDLPDSEIYIFFFYKWPVIFVNSANGNQR